MLTNEKILPPVIPTPLTLEDVNVQVARLGAIEIGHEAESSKENDAIDFTVPHAELEKPLNEADESHLGAIALRLSIYSSDKFSLPSVEN